jgi:hypothetical protein
VQVNATFGAIVWEGRISNPCDDVEQQLPSNMYITSSDLEMPYEDTGKGTPQIIGLRFLNVGVPRGATVVNAHIEFA